MQPGKRSRISDGYVDTLTEEIRLFFSAEKDIPEDCRQGALLMHYIKWLHYRNQLIEDYRLDSTTLNLYDDVDARIEFVLSRFDSLYAEFGE